MAELNTTDERTADACCVPEAQASCCEPSAKSECCDADHGEGCECSADRGGDTILRARRQERADAIGTRDRRLARVRATEPWTSPEGLWETAQAVVGATVRLRLRSLWSRTAYRPRPAALA